MGTTKTAEEITQERIVVMGEELGLLYNSLHNEIIWIHMKWRQYEDLFGSTQNRIEIMNESAPYFFFTIQKVLWNDVLLGLSRITDNVQVSGKRTVTIKAIEPLLADPRLKEKVSTQVELILTKCSFCRDWRNRTIAHKDYSLHINSSNAKPLEEANRKKVTEAIKEFHALINILEGHFFKSQLVDLKYIEPHGAAYSLLVRLNDGLKRDKELFERKKSGTATKDDFKRDEI